MAHIDDKITQKSNLGYIRQAMGAPMLECEHEFELARLWRTNGDEKALDELVKAYMRLVVAMASRFRHYGLPLGDLIQEGNIGLMEAAKRFEPERQVRFSTYAKWWIRCAIQEYILRNWSIVRTGTTTAQKALFFNLRRLRAKIERRQNSNIMDETGRMSIARELKVSMKDVTEMEGRLSGNDQSLNAPISERNEYDWQSLLSDERPNPEDVVISMKDSQTRSQWLKEALDELSDRERKIITERHLGQDAVTLEDLGHQLGVSKERVRQIEARAMDKIKESLIRHVSDRGELWVAGFCE